MLRIGVIGQSGDIPDDMKSLAIQIGREIARKGAVLFTGGTTGVMEGCCRGAREAGGLVVGFLPGDTLEMANGFIDIPITTGLAFDYRSSVMIHSSDAVIMIGGGNGTLGELSCAYLNKKPVVILESSGGWASKVRQFAFEGIYMDDRRNIKLDFAFDAEEAVELAVSRASESKGRNLHARYNGADGYSKE
ncbi:MAG: TIGR00725 family protein [Bacillota bacterium]|nr:TIGR00725 family protein [Bacillota bacterium]